MYGAAIAANFGKRQSVERRVFAHNKGDDLEWQRREVAQFGDDLELANGTREAQHGAALAIHHARREHGEDAGREDRGRCGQNDRLNSVHPKRPR